MKKLLRFAGLTFLVILLSIAIYLYLNVDIISAYAAKSTCSCLFVAERDQTGAEDDLSFFPISLAESQINFDTKSVTSSVRGLKKRTARYRPGLGCALIKGEDDFQPAFSIPLSSPPPDSLAWPYGTQEPKPAPLPENPEQLDQAFEFVFLPESHTRALLVVKDDLIVREKYGPGFDRDTRQTGWSMTKCIAGTVVGLLSQKGEIELGDPVSIPDWSGDERQVITMEHLLRMASGLQWSENYFSSSDVNQMLFREENTFAFASSKPFHEPPGSSRKYSSGTSNIISGLLRKKMPSEEAYWALPYRELFHQIGMYTARLETDAAGNYILSSHCYATPRDWAKFGLLYLHRGNWNGRQVLSEEWVDYSVRPDPNDPCHGINFGLNTDGCFFPDAPVDLYFASGFNGQKVYVIPSEDMVIVRLALTNFFDENRMLKEILASFETPTKGI